MTNHELSNRLSQARATESVEYLRYGDYLYQVNKIGDTALVVLRSNVASDMRYVGRFLCENIGGIATLHIVATNYATNTESMFKFAKIDSLDLSGFDTSRVDYMVDMFRSAKIGSLDLSGFDTSSVKYMHNMFRGAKIGNLDLTGWDTSRVTDMCSMFEGAEIDNLDLSGFDTSSAKYMGKMFREAKIDRLDLSGFNTSRVTTMMGMFKDAEIGNLITDNPRILEEFENSQK